MRTKTLILSIMLLLATGIAEAKKVRVVAHRGYWNTEGSARNSISALNNAMAIKAYGSEFDVNITSDGILIVHHDAKTANGLLIEDHTFAELREKAPKLKNDELIPTLDDYLTAWNHNKKTKLVFEIKPQSSPELETKMVEACLEALRKNSVTDKEVEFIAFSYHVCKELKRLRPTAIVMPLSTTSAEPEQMFKDGMDGFDLHYSVLREHPEWVELAKSQKKIVNVWTVNQEDVMREMIALGVDYITTDEPVLLQQVIKGKKK